MSRRRQQWSIKSFVEWTGRKLAGALVPPVVVLGAGQDDARGQVGVQFMGQKLTLAIPPCNPNCDSDNSPNCCACAWVCKPDGGADV
ncbi:MAG: hypothetical protein JW384_00032 [Nitrosomonadaceae bacterium]|nr:hypothetical protein [Nitrosomonadaceae bacterium]